MSQLKAVQDRLLEDVSNALIPEGYISEMMLPLIQVKEKTGKLGKYGKDHLRIEHSLAGGRGKYRTVESITRSTDSYSVESHGLRGEVTEDDYANVQSPFDAEKDETIGLTTLIWLGKEKALADTLSNTSVITQNQTNSGTSQYNDYANSDPLADAKTARLAVRNGCGLPPNVAAMDWAVANTLAYHPGILEALGFTMNRAGQLSDAELAKALGVEKLLIAKAVYNSAKEGQADSLGAVWGKHVIYGRLPEKAAKYQVSGGYRVQMAGRPPRRVFKSDISNPPNATEILVDDAYQFLISTVGAFYLVKNAIA